MNTTPETPKTAAEYRWQERLLELCLLEDGWLDGEDGIRMSAEASDSAWAICERIEKDGYPSPALFPTVEGGIQIEWILGDFHDVRHIIVFQLEPDLSYDLHRVRISDKSYDEIVTPLMDEAFTKLRSWFDEFEKVDTP